MSDVRVSVVITSYNHKDYLVEAIESVLAQTRPADEIIVADDGSTDGSENVILQYVSTYPSRVIGVLNQRNQGIPANRNSALARMTGDYVYILDGDDRFLPTNIERSLEELNGRPGYSCVYSNVDLIDASGRQIGTRDKNPQPAGDIFYEVARGKFGMLRNMIISTPLLRDAGFMDTRLPAYDGFELTVRLARLARIGYVFDSLAEYRVHAPSYSKGMAAQDHIRDFERIYRKLRLWTRELDVEQRAALQEVWKGRLARFHVRRFLESPTNRRKQTERLRLLAKRYVGLRDAIRFDEVIERYRP